LEKFNLGGTGVYFFFVLSGFLITYLLLKEQHLTKSISIKKFYMRRIFRIWPVYYLLLCLGFFVFPNLDFINLPYASKHLHSNFHENLFLYILILPNVAFSLFPAVPHIGQSWSIGVEEQFYIFWPLLLKKVSNIKKSIFLIFCSYVTLKIVVLFLTVIFPQSDLLQSIKLFLAMSKFECMMIGAYGAVLFFDNSSDLRKFCSNLKILFLIIISIPFINLFFTDGLIQNGIHILLSLLFLYVILFTCYNIKENHFLNNRTLDYLGKLSFGIYMYHLLGLAIVVSCMKLIYPYFNLNEFWIDVFILVFTIIITLLFSGISYKYYEKVFLKVKAKFEVKC
jgi:peptidoglycan/LPS O-acetylase OafA/YrhL